MNTRKFSSEQENKISKAVGGKVQPNSGATPFKKGDIITANWLIEAKTKIGDEWKQFSIKKDWLAKLREETFAMGKKFSALVFDFGAGSERYYVLSEQDFLELKNCWEENNDD